MPNTASGATAAIVGAGNIGRTHAAAYKALGVPILAVCDADDTRASALAAEVQAAAYTSVAEMAADIRPTVVSICTPPASHVAAACAILERGIPVLCEKPLADSVAGARAIVETARASGTYCMTGFCHRFHEPVLQVKEHLDAGAIGTPVLFRNRFAYQFKDVERSWFADRAISGGGTVMDTSVHSLDLYRFLVGEITTVVAQLSTITPGLSVEDNSVLLVNGPARVPGIIEASWTTPVGESALVIYGTGGNLSVDYGSGDFGVARIQRTGDPAPAELPRRGHDRFAAELAHLIACIDSGTAPVPDGHDGLRILQIIEGAYRAAESAGCIEVPPRDTPRD